MELIGRILRWTPGTMAAAFLLACFLSALAILSAVFVIEALDRGELGSGSPGEWLLGLVSTVFLAGVVGFFYIAPLVAIFGLLPVLLFRRVADRWWFGVLSVIYGAGVSRWLHGPLDPLTAWEPAFGEHHLGRPPLPVLAMGALTALLWWVLARRVIVRDVALETGTHYVGENGELVRCTD